MLKNTWFHKVWLVSCFIMGGLNLCAQEYEVSITNGKSTAVKKFRSVPLMCSYLEKEVNRLQVEGYLEATYDTIKTGVNRYTCTFSRGILYEWGQIEPRGYVQAIGPKTGRVFNGQSFSQQAEKNIRELENSGYPFCTVVFDSVRLDKGKVSGIMLVDKGKLYVVDSLVSKGNVKLPKIYLQKYLGIKRGSPYNEKLVRQINTRLKEIPFVTPVRASEVLFTQNQCMIFTYLKKRNASSFNGILGIQPDAITGKTTITGDARIILKNAFGKAETFDLNWRKVANQTQDLKVNVILPFLFNSPLGTDATLKLFKRDTSFLELNRNIGLTWQMSRGNYFRVFYNRYNSDVLSRTIYTSGKLALQNADVGIDQYGIGIRYERLDYRINPRKGLAVSTDFSAGTKRIRPNGVNDESLYENVKLKTDYYNGMLVAEGFVPLARSFTIKMGAQSRFIVNEKLYQNELLRFGGLKTLRGFNEEAIYASAYAVGTAEFRFLFEENSNLFVFFDQGWYENNAADVYVNDTPYGLGAGVSFQVKTGVFSFTWALGKQFDNPVLLKNSKLHFGFINYF